jgi:hypothetical protein
MPARTLAPIPHGTAATALSLKAIVMKLNVVCCTCWWFVRSSHVEVEEAMSTRLKCGVHDTSRKHHHIQHALHPTAMIRCLYLEQSNLLTNVEMIVFQLNADVKFPGHPSQPDTPFHFCASLVLSSIQQEAVQYARYQLHPTDYSQAPGPTGPTTQSPQFVQRSIRNSPGHL